MSRSSLQSSYLVLLNELPVVFGASTRSSGPASDAPPPAIQDSKEDGKPNGGKDLALDF